MQRRHFISLAAGFAASPVFAAGNPLPAVASVRPVMPPRDVGDLIMTDADGARVQLNAFSGRIVVLNFWASWCAPCRSEMPSLSRLAARVDPAKIVVLALSFDKPNPTPAQRFLDQEGIINLPILMGDAQNMETVLGWGLLPTTIVLNTSGQHIYTTKGDAIWDDDATLKWLNYLAA